MAFKPLSDRVLIKPVEQDKVSAGGIFIPPTAQGKEATVQGRVLAVGPGKTSTKGELVPMTVAKGDVVVFSKFSGQEIQVDGDDCLLVKESDVLGVIHD
jgi:chaperonin GroES